MKFKLCLKHGGQASDMNQGDAFWYCEVCSREGINKCKCGGNGRIFAEALMGAVTCDTCGDSVSGIGVNVRKLWNDGIRGYVE